jgi:hypothetical protein
MARVVGQDPGVAKRKSCRGCGSIVEYYINDVKRRDGRDYSGGADGEEWVDCPNEGCGHKIILRSW